jgi:hypothetical protein
VTGQRCRKTRKNANPKYLIKLQRVKTEIGIPTSRIANDRLYNGWRAIPKDLPPRSTLFDYLDLWSYDGTLDRIHHALYVACREQGEREASPTAAIVDSQSVKGAEKGGPASIRMAMMRAKRSRGRSAIFS